MNLKDLLGSNYHEGMTFDEISNVLADKKLADLSTGAYVDKNKYDADIKAKDSEIQKKAQELSAKMTADEKAQAEEAKKDALIEELKKQILDSNIYNSKSTAESILAGSKTILGIKDDDTAYQNFIGSISTDNLESTKVVATYINKLVQDSYKKGKDDASKNNLGAFSKGVGSAETGDGKPINNYGAQLAKMNTIKNVDSNLYFKDKTE
jgi:hypothetical protein